MKRINATHFKQRCFSSSFDIKCGISKTALITAYCLPCLEVAARELVLVPISYADPREKRHHLHIHTKAYIYPHIQLAHLTQYRDITLETCCLHVRCHNSETKKNPVVKQKGNAGAHKSWANSPTSGSPFPRGFADLAGKLKEQCPRR